MRRSGAPHAPTSGDDYTLPAPAEKGPGVVRGAGCTMNSRMQRARTVVAGPGRMPEGTMEQLVGLITGLFTDTKATMYRAR